MDIQTSDSNQAPGLDIHEMGGVRMGRNTKTSLRNDLEPNAPLQKMFLLPMALA